MVDYHINVKRLEKFSNESDIAKETVSLLQKNIQTITTNPPGNEIILAKYLKELIDKENFENISTKIIETAPSRGNLIITVQGTDPENYPTWGFASHLDVVPVNEKYWDHPPFSGELIDDKKVHFEVFFNDVEKVVEIEVKGIEVRDNDCITLISPNSKPISLGTGLSRSDFNEIREKIAKSVSPEIWLKVDNWDAWLYEESQWK